MADDLVRHSDSEAENDDENVEALMRESESESESEKSDYLPIGDIAPELTKWKIIGRVVRKSRLFTYNGSTPMFYFGIQDKSGIIKVKAFGDLAQKYFPIVQKGKIYTLEHGKVCIPFKKNQTYPHQSELTITKNSSITEQNDDIELLQLSAKRNMLADIKNLPTETTINFEAIIRKVGSVKEIENTQMKKLELEIFDESMESGKTIRLTLWNNDINLIDGLDFKKYYYKISIEEANTNIFSKEFSINSTKASTITISRISNNSNESQILANWKPKLVVGKRLKIERPDNDLPAANNLEKKMEDDEAGPSGEQNKEREKNVNKEAGPQDKKSKNDPKKKKRN